MSARRDAFAFSFFFSSSSFSSFDLMPLHIFFFFFHLCAHMPEVRACRKTCVPAPPASDADYLPRRAPD